MGSYGNQVDPLSDGAAIVAGYNSSGLTRADYCRRIGISVHKLDYHQRRSVRASCPVFSPCRYRLTQLPPIRNPQSRWLSSCATGANWS